MEAPDSLVGQKLACPRCGCERKVPKSSSKPRPPTARQKAFAEKLGIKFDETITFDEISEKITTVTELRYFVMDVWKEMTETKFFECGITDLEINRIVGMLMANENLSKEILIFKEKQYEEACEKSNEAREEYYSQGSSEPLGFTEYLPSIRGCKVFGQVSAILQREWSKYVPKAKNSFWKRLFS
jgi:hypothetical protein